MVRQLLAYIRIYFRFLIKVKNVYFHILKFFMEEKSLKYWAEQANRILEGNPDGEFMRNKNAIAKLFENENSLENIYLRLYVLDSLYSTQMNRRLFGFDKLARNLESIHKKVEIKKGSDVFGNYLVGSCKDITDLLSDKYGIGKGKNEEIQDGQGIKTAVSLISKYLYYATQYEFPIYDSLAKIIYTKILERYSDDFKNNKIPKSIDNESPAIYFGALNDLKNEKQIKNFNCLDNLLWLAGKIQNGSFGYLISETQFVKFKKWFYNKVDKKVKSAEFDKELYKQLSNDKNNVEEAFQSCDDNLKEFIKFVLFDLSIKIN